MFTKLVEGGKHTGLSLRKGRFQYQICQLTNFVNLYIVLNCPNFFVVVEFPYYLKEQMQNPGCMNNYELKL